MSISISRTQSARKPTGVFLSVTFLILLILSFLAVRIQFQTDHYKKHNNDANLTEQCLNRNGIAYAIQENLSGCIHLICTESQTEFYDVIYQDRGTLDGITAFRVTKLVTKRGTFEFHTVEDYIAYLQGRGDTLISTSQFTGPFIFVYP